MDLRKRIGGEFFRIQIRLMSKIDSDFIGIK